MSAAASPKPVVVVFVIDQSYSMSRHGKWNAVLEGLADIARKNAGLPIRAKRVFFQVHRNADRNFIPIEQVAEDIPGRPDGETAFFDAGRRGMDYLLEELEKDPEAIGQIFFLTDGMDNQSAPHSMTNLARTIDMALYKYNHGRPLEESRLMVTMLAFGNGSEHDRARHTSLAKKLHIPSAWFRYYVGAADRVLSASESIGASVHSASTAGYTRYI